MRRYLGILAMAATLAAADAPPAWLYPSVPPNPSRVLDNVTKRSLPGSSLRLTEKENADLFRAADWYPGDHPPMPALVSRGTPPALYACGTCHLTTGGGRPENAALAGLPASYIVAQVRAFGTETRRTSSGRPSPMLAIARAASPEQVAAAARYFAALPPHRFGRVVEATQIPRVDMATGIWHKSARGGTEPLGARLIEVPDDLTRHEMRDPRLGYTAYVPVGSIARGAALAANWGSKAYACATCHGPGYRGAIGPRLAGRSPGYLARQLYNFKSGARGGPASVQMAQVTRDMTVADMVALAAFMGNAQP